MADLSDIEKQLKGIFGDTAALVGGAFNKTENVLKSMVGAVLDFYNYWEKVNDEVLKVNKNFGGTLKSINKSGSYSQVFYTNLKKSLPTIELLGSSAEEVSKAVADIADHTGSMVGASSKALTNYAALSKTLGAENIGGSIEALTDMGYGFQSSTEYMNDMLLTSQKMGINATKAASVLNKNFKNASNISFKGGAKEIAEMARQSVLLGVDMSKVLEKVDQLRSPEEAIEFSQQMQMLGGSFADLFGDSMDVLDMSRNDPKKFTKRVGEAAQSLMTLNEQGELVFQGADLDRAKLAAQQLGMTVNDLKESGVKMQKMNILKNAFGGIDEEQAGVLSGFVDMTKSKGGKITLTGLEGLSEENIKKLGVTMDSEGNIDASMLSAEKMEELADALREKQVSDAKLMTPEAQAKAVQDQVLASQNLTTQIKNLTEVFKSRTPDISGKLVTDKLGSNGEVVMAGFNTQISNFSTTLATSGDGFAKKIDDGADGVADKLKEGATIVTTTFATGAEKLLEKYGSKFLESFKDSKAKGGLLEYGDGGLLEYGDGGVFDGPSHKDGGIQAFNKNSGKIVEVEGGEAIINKKSSQMFKPILSALNEAGGGIKFADGGITPGNLNTMMSKMTSNVANVNVGSSSPVNVNVNVNGTITIDGKNFKIPDEQKDMLSSNIMKQVMLKVNSEINQGTIFTAGKKTKTDNTFE
jgi:hypothetical protein